MGYRRHFGSTPRSVRAAVASGASNTPYASPFSLEILNIKPAGTGTPALPSTNRIFRAYSGLEYNIRAAVRGGSFPYTFALSGEPSGMTVSSNGTISWPNPTSSSGTITLTVTDSIGTQVTADWSITVGTSGFHFLDNTYVGTSTGSITQPWKTLNDFVTGAAGASTDILYIRGLGGSYTFTTDDGGGGYDGADGPANDGDTGTDGGALYVNYGSNTAPETWLAYPGDTMPVIDCQESVFLRTTKPYLDGLKFINGREYIWKAESGSHYKAIRRCVFDGVTGHTATNRNQGFLFVVSAGAGQYMHVSNNSFANSEGAEMLGSMYNSDDTLIENNTFDGGGVTGLHGFTTYIGHKLLNDRSTVRQNVINIPTGANYQEFYNQSGSGIEFCYNKVLRADSGTCCRYAEEIAVDFVCYRNTFKGDWDFDGVQNDFIFAKNIIEGSYVQSTGVTFTDNLEGTFGQGIIDSSGNLTSGYLSYLGTHGAQIP